MESSMDPGTAIAGEEIYRRSSHCNSSTCVEVAVLKSQQLVKVRDSKNPAAPAVTFAAPEWAAFLDGVRNSEFDI